MFKTKLAGLWRTAEPLIKVDGVWRKAKAAYVRVNGVYKKFYSETVALDKLATWWDFDNNLTDYVEALLASLGDGATIETVGGKVGVRLYGGRFVSIPSFSHGASWTINLWYYPVSFTTYSHLLTNAAGQANFALKLTPTQGIPYFHSGTSGSVMAAQGLTLSKWSMVTFTYENGTVKIYIDGVLSVTAALTLSLPAGECFIGKGHLSEYSDGYQRDVMRWTQALTASEVAELYAIQQ